MGIIVYRKYAVIILINTILAVSGCCSKDTVNDSRFAGKEEKGIGLSSHSVFMSIGEDTFVVTTRHDGWVIDSVRVYEDIVGSKLLDNTFRLSEKDKKKDET